MFNILSPFLKYFSIVLIISSLSFNYIQYNRIQICSLKVSSYEQQINQLEKDSKEAKIKAEKAKKEADAALIKSKKNSEKIMASYVPKDCSKSIMWGIDQVKFIK